MCHHFPKVCKKTHLRKLVRCSGIAEAQVKFYGQETTDELFDKTYIWRSTDEAFKPKNTILADKHGGGSLILLDSFAPSGED